MMWDVWQSCRIVRAGEVGRGRGWYNQARFPCKTYIWSDKGWEWQLLAFVPQNRPLSRTD